MEKGNLNIKLHNLKKVVNEEGIVDETQLKATFLILEVDVESGNNQIITKEEALKMAGTMKLKPLTCQYIPTTDFENPNDHFGGHGVFKDKYREGGEEFISTNSFAIGVAEEGCYLDTITNEEGVEVECLFCDYVLWAYRYPNIVGLMNDIFEKGESLFSSCEYLYSKFLTVDGIVYPMDLIFDGHCILCSGENGSTAIEPAFKESKMITFNEKLKVAINEVVYNSVEGGDKMAKAKNEKEVEIIEETIIEPVKVVNELSQENVRGELRKQITEHLGVDKYDVWVSSDLVYDSFFVYELWNSEESEYQYFKASFTRQGDVVTVDTNSIEKVERKTIWVTQDEVQLALNAKEEVIKELNSEKEALQVKYNEVSESVLSLNSTVEGLKDKADKYDTHVFNEKVAENKKFYEEKFVGLNAKAKFEKEDVQELIIKSVNSAEAKMELNEILIGLVPKVKVVNETSKETKVKSVNEEPVKNENLLPTKAKSFEERYGL